MTKLTKQEQDRRIGLWLEALRDPNQKQVTERLETEQGRCCLGVLCRVAEKEGLKLDIREYPQATTFDGKISTLPISVKEWIGLTSETGTYSGQLFFSKP